MSEIQDWLDDLAARYGRTVAQIADLKPRLEKDLADLIGVQGEIQKSMKLIEEIKASVEAGIDPADAWKFGRSGEE